MKLKVKKKKGQWKNVPDVFLKKKNGKSNCHKDGD